tara:strand:- start:474 stop:902 length:429 start_codon:yes stop_codon:yes gene_type:complete
MAALDKTKVLIAGSDLFEVTRLESLLSGRDYSVIASVNTGKEAVTGAQWLRPDLVLMELEADGEADSILAAEEIGMTITTPVIFFGDRKQSDALMRDNRIAAFGFFARSADEETVLNLADHVRSLSSEPGEACEWEVEFTAG